MNIRAHLPLATTMAGTIEDLLKDEKCNWWVVVYPFQNDLCAPCVQGHNFNPVTKEFACRSCATAYALKNAACFTCGKCTWVDAHLCKAKYCSDCHHAYVLRKKPKRAPSKRPPPRPKRPASTVVDYDDLTAVARTPKGE
jgi:hypothetical protein